MRFGLPGTWLVGADLLGGEEPQDTVGRCGCRQPLIWDSKRGYWRHLNDGSPCLANTSQEVER